MLKKNLVTLSLSFLLGLSSTALACPFHDNAGYGGWGGFGGRPSFKETGAQTAAPSQESLSISAPAMMGGILGREVSIAVDYKTGDLQDAQTVQLSISADPSMSIEGPAEVDVAAGKGKHVFKLIPSKSGTFKVHLVALRRGDDPSKASQKAVYLRVQS